MWHPAIRTAIVRVVVVVIRRRQRRRRRQINRQQPAGCMHRVWEYRHQVLTRNRAGAIRRRRALRDVDPRCERIRWHRCACCHIIRSLRHFVNACLCWKNWLMLAMSRPARSGSADRDRWFGKFNTFFFLLLFHSIERSNFLWIKNI